MKVLLASRHLAVSTLLNKVEVYASKADVPKQKKSTKAKERVVVEAEVNGETVREQWVKEQLREFDRFMQEHEARLGITREHFVQAKKDSLTPMQKLMEMLTSLGDKAEGVLTINQKLSQEVSAQKTDIQRLNDANSGLSKENDKLLRKLKELNERLHDQSSAREIYEKEAKALREQLTKKHADRFSARVAEEAERIKDNDKKAHGPVRLYSDDPEWKNWYMLVKACPKCGCSVSPFPKRTVGCSQGCKAADDAESMSPEAWNEWALAYEPEEPEKSDGVEHHIGEGVALKVGGKVIFEDDDTEVEMPPPDDTYYTEEREPEQGDGRLAQLEVRVEELAAASAKLADLLQRVLDRDPTHPLDDLIGRLEREGNVVADLIADVDWADSEASPARRAYDLVHRWQDALIDIVIAFRDRDKDPEVWLRIDAAIATL